MENQQKYLVAIQCITYNHEKYLADALEGFVMQKTNFPFVAIVHDDASTDGTADILRKYAEKYPDIIHPIYETENQYSKRDGSLGRIMDTAVDATGAKYIALCEGDDYWTDPLKLQKQVDFLESHPDYSMCFHNVEVESPNESNKKMYQHLEEREFLAEEVYKKWTIPTCTVLYRYDMWEKRRKISPNAPIIFGDIVLFLSMAEQGRLYCLNFKGGVYRRHEGGASVKTNKLALQRVLAQYQWMKKTFPQKNLLPITRNNIDQYIYYIANLPPAESVLRYRIWYMLRHPDLFFSTYLTTTILSYSFLRFLK